MESTWGPSGADRTQVGPMLAPWTLLSGQVYSQNRDDNLNVENFCYFSSWYATITYAIMIRSVHTLPTLMQQLKQPFYAQSKRHQGALSMLCCEADDLYFSKLNHIMVSVPVAFYALSNLVSWQSVLTDKDLRLPWQHFWYRECLASEWITAGHIYWLLPYRTGE